MEKIFFKGFDMAIKKLNVVGLVLLFLVSSCIFNNNQGGDGQKNNSNDNEIQLTVSLDASSEIQNHVTNVSLTPSALINFNRDVDASSVSIATIELKDSTDNIVPDYKLIVRGNKVALNIAKPLSEFSKYTIKLTNQISDQSGHHLSETMFDFTTGNKIYPVAYLLTPSDANNASQTPNI